MSPSERLRENIRKYRTEARLLVVDPTSLEDDSDDADELENSSVLQSPTAEKEAEMKLAEMSSGERWLKLKAEVSDNMMMMAFIRHQQFIIVIIITIDYYYHYYYYY